MWFGSGRWGGSIGWGWFSILSNRKENRKKNYILIIPLSDWTNIYFASILADSAFSSICTLISSCPLIPGSNTPVYVSGPCTLVISLSLSLMYPNIPGLLFLTFVICRILASLSIVTGVAVSFNVVKLDSGIE